VPEGRGLVFDAAVTRGAFRFEASFAVAPGETLAVVGPSGAGKTTALALVAGLLRPDRGRIACGGETWCDTSSGAFLAPEARRVGVVFQEYALFPHLTVRENVAYGPRARGRGRAEAMALAARWLDTLGLSALGDRGVGGISGGERQRVAIARALASEPAALLLDEPFGALDVATRGALRSDLRAFLARCALPTVLVAHDPVDAFALADRVAVTERGTLTQVGTHEELLAHPRGAFVAELAGLNLYRAVLAPGRGLKEARVGVVAFHVLADDWSGPSFLAFAPSEVALAPERLPGSPQNVFPGRVVEVQPLPDRLRVVLDVGVTMAADVTREAGASLGLTAGRTVWASVKATAIRVYG
jgi:molybdate transport system ATP-binding protein